MDKKLRDKAKQFAATIDALPDASEHTHADANAAQKRRKREKRRNYGVLASLLGVVVCSQLGLGVGQALCHGALAVSLGTPHRHSM